MRLYKYGRCRTIISFSLTVALDWLKKWDLSILQNAIISQSGEKLPCDCYFSPWAWHPTPVSNLVKGLGVQADYVFSPSAQCTEAANKARRLIFMKRR